ncbi:MAG: aldo/keto reductase [Candidatus Brocadiia bacterium]
MQYAILGKTKLRVSRLGFGCMRFPMRGEHVDRDLSIPLLRRAVELGVNYFDSAVGYCNQESQRVVGEAFEGMRDRVILSTKNPFYNKKDEKTWWTNLENSLERLRTDHIDLYNFHGLNWKAFQEHVDGPDGQLRWMQRAKDDGRIRHIGFSFHDKMENLKKLAGTGLFEAVTLQYNLLDRSNEPAFEFVGDKCGMGIVVMGPVGGGRLGGESEEIRRMIRGARSVPEVALRFVLSNPHVTVALSGMADLRQLEENVPVASHKTALSAGEKRSVLATMGRFKKLAELYCTGCRYCMPCPYGVDIPGNFSALNLQRVYGLKEEARKAYARLSSQGRYCMACGACKSKCPQKIDIVRQLKESVRTLDEAYGHLFARVVPTDLTKLRAGSRKWSATLAGKLDVLNMSDNPAEAAVTFKDSNGVRIVPSESAAKLDSFKRKVVRLEIACCGGPFSGLVETGAAVKSASTVDLFGKCFHVAFAAPAGKSGARAAHGVPIRLGLREQLAKGTSRVLERNSATCRFAHDDKALYFSAAVKSDLHAPASKDRRPGQTDRVTLWIDARPSDQAGRPGRSSKFYEIGFLAPGEDAAPSVRVFQPWGAAENLATSKSRRIPGGYAVEAVLPWAGFEIPKAKRKRLAIQVSLIGHNRLGQPTVELHWTGGDAAQKLERYGHLFLAKE